MTSPKVNYPAAQIVGPGVTTPALTASSSSVIKAPTGSSGFKPAYFRITVTAGAAHVKWGQATSISAVTSDTLVNAGDALWLNALGINAFAAIHPLAGATAGSYVNVMPCEEGVLRPPVDSSGLG